MSSVLIVLRIAGGYLPWLVVQLLASTLVLARDVCTPGSTQSPRIVKVPMAGLSDLEVTLFTSSITITPGTLVLAIAGEDEHGPAATFVQGLFGEDEEALMDGLVEMRRRVLLATRGRGGSGGPA